MYSYVRCRRHWRMVSVTWERDASWLIWVMDVGTIRTISRSHPSATTTTIHGSHGSGRMEKQAYGSAPTHAKLARLASWHWGLAWRSPVCFVPTTASTSIQDPCSWLHIRPSASSRAARSQVASTRSRSAWMRPHSQPADLPFYHWGQFRLVLPIERVSVCPLLI